LKPGLSFRQILGPPLAVSSPTPRTYGCRDHCHGVHVHGSIHHHEEKTRFHEWATYENIRAQARVVDTRLEIITHQAAFAGSSSRPPTMYARIKQSHARLRGGGPLPQWPIHFGAPLHPHTIPPDQMTKIGYRRRVRPNTLSAASGYSLFPPSMASFDVLWMLARY
jgi:hypothetical protein